MEGPDMEARSARLRTLSAKLKPSPVAKTLVSMTTLDRVGLWRFREGVDEGAGTKGPGERCCVEGDEQDKPRLLRVGGDLGLAMEGLPLAFPTFPFPPARTSRRARAPKLKRRAKGVGGMLEAVPGASSSKGLSSTEPEVALEMLSPRERWLKGEVWFGEAERPKVVRDRRRRCA